MEEQLSFFNLSLNKVVNLEADSFKKAKIKIIFTILVFTLIKVLIAMYMALLYSQYIQLFRSGVICLLFLVLIKVLLYRPSRILIISHFIVLGGLSVIWGNLFLNAEHLTILTVQLVFMVTLISYYLIGGLQAACYTIAAIGPVIFFLLTKNQAIWRLDITPQGLTSPGFEIVVVLNFLTFVLVHYLYSRAFYQNLKEKESLNQQLQVNIAEAKALAESRAIFLSTMSHELRTPLNGVIGMANLLRDTARDEQKDNLDILEFSATNLLSVINDVLDYNKSELGKIELENLPVNLSTLLTKICSGLEMKAVEKALIWKVELDAKLKGKLVLTDPTRLTQIIYNLVGNAIKFTEKGMVSVKALVLNQSDDEISIQFSIQDTGIGIPADRQDVIFDPFTQASSDTTRRYGGTGLGLAIVKRLLKLFNSAIQLESFPGKGSLFTFTIGFSLCQRRDMNTASDRVEKNSLKGLKLLIVEDNHINVLLLERLLFRWEIQCVVAVNGQEALNKLSDDSFDGVLMDLHMPVMDGYTATLAIRSLADPEKSKIPIIALTASVSNNVYDKIKEVGMQDYLPKPFQADQLYEKLQQVCCKSVVNIS